MPTSRTSTESPTYGTWIRTRAIVVFAVLTTGCLALSLFVFVTPWALLALLLAAAFGWILLILAMARYRFSDTGGQYQRRIHALIRSHATGTTILDIGCGNGHLAIQLAKDKWACLEDPARHVTGLDYWGTAWEYSKQVCDRNAELEGVAGRVTFVQGSAASLPFPDAHFDCVVSCLTFHEVRELDDKTLALTEALRVLRPGGTFTFFDLFADPGPYPQQHLIRERLAASGALDITEALLSSLMPLPFPLNGKRVLKYACLITGRKLEAPQS